MFDRFFGPRPLEKKPIVFKKPEINREKITTQLDSRKYEFQNKERVAELTQLFFQSYQETVDLYRKKGIPFKQPKVEIHKGNPEHKSESGSYI